MHIEIRKNGTFYLKDSVYNRETKLPKNTSIYLGSNPIQAKSKLKTLTDDLVLLEQIPNTFLYEIELDKAIKNLQKLNNLQTAGIGRLIKEYLHELLQAKQFISKAREGVLAPTSDCPDCRFKNANHCDHFNQNFITGNIKYRDKSLRCPAYELGQTKSPIGSIKLPRDFR
ncbi:MULTISPECIES: hypothetical protein [Sporomusa]|jgi:hypothetical protein|uniref:hypothetical protein n=1 Tax=Sporomusa TaxID=2375 RepID=UPI001666A4D9|nr:MULTISPECIES: hypothetical protein [Sporomusa]MCM0757197.1 hypothetical protein [Sporomusa sphaeroides DSM 2875]